MNNLRLSWQAQISLLYFNFNSTPQVTRYEPEKIALAVDWTDLTSGQSKHNTSVSLARLNVGRAAVGERARVYTTSARRREHTTHAIG
jgi:hypothetical protein